MKSVSQTVHLKNPLCAPQSRVVGSAGVTLALLSPAAVLNVSVRSAVWESLRLWHASFSLNQNEVKHLLFALGFPSSLPDSEAAGAKVAKLGELFE